MVLRNAGPIGAPGMPEWGHLPIPAKLLRQGVSDLLRISDARMSGTSYGAIVLHVAPESAVGGPLALVRGRRPDPPRRGGATPRPRRRAGRARGAASELVAAAAQGRARVSAAACRPRPAGQRGLRLRLPPWQGGGRGGRRHVPLRDEGPRHRRSRKGRPRPRAGGCMEAGYEVRATDLARSDLGPGRSRTSRRTTGRPISPTPARPMRSLATATPSCTRRPSRSRSTTRRTSSSATTS